jgi:hypothetical protein
VDPPPQFPDYVPRQRLLPKPENLAKLQREIKDANPRDAWLLRFEVVRMLEAARRYDEAAAASVENALGETPKSYPMGLRAKRAALDWSLNRRKAQSARFFAEHRELIAVARSTAYHVEGARWNSGRVFGQEWLSEGEVAARLSELGPGVLAVVHEKLQPNTVSGEDRTVFVRVVENIGGEEDIPLLIDLLGLTVKSSEERDLTVPGNEKLHRQDRLSEAALHRALEKLTGVKNTVSSREERVIFWQSWWDANARRVLAAVD